MHCSIVVHTTCLLSSMKSEDNYKVCPLCGWVYPGDYTRNRCAKCGGTLWQRFPCMICGAEDQTWKPLRIYKNSTAAALCDSCASDLVVCRSKHLTLMDTSTRLLESWKRNMANQPPSPLTEDEWYETCCHFNGCAVCGKPQIDIRSMFVGTTNGGKYAKWNVIPLCDSCTYWLRLKGKDNPFKVFGSPLSAAALPLLAKQYEEAMAGIVTYLYSLFENPVDSHIWTYKEGASNYITTLRDREEYQRSIDYES